MFVVFVSKSCEGNSLVSSEGLSQGGIALIALAYLHHSVYRNLLSYPLSLACSWRSQRF